MEDRKAKIEKRLEKMKSVYIKAGELIDGLPDAIPEEIRTKLKDTILGDRELKNLMEGIDSHRPPKIFLIGRTGVGKSSLINALCGSYLAKVSDALYEAIKEKNKINNKSRVVAGYCWEWEKNSQNDPNVFDIEIPEYHFAKSWNLNNTSTWAIDEESIKEIGCIHTCQGLEFDYAGVIIGNDMRYENETVITDYTKRAESDKSLDGLKGPAKKNDPVALKEVDRIIRNTYKTLMTRGMKGCYIYCCDKALNEYFKTRRNQNRK